MFVWSTRTSEPYKGFQPGRYPRLTYDDIVAIKQYVPEVELVSPRLTLGNSPIYFKDKGDVYQVRGELSDMIKLEALKLHAGRYINQNDIDESRKVTVIGTLIKDVLFGTENAIGQYVRLRGVEFRVVGVFGPEQIKPWTEDDLESAVIPLTTMHRTFGMDNRIDYFVCSAAPNVRVSQMEPKVKNLLKQRHNVAPSDPRGIDGFNLEEEFRSIQTVFKGIKFFLWFVGIGTLLAGVVGVSNIMLIIVKERTKEIGIRKIIGASISRIFVMLTAEIIKWIFIANLIALPLAYYFMNKWLQGFAYPVDINWVTFAAALFISLLVALITVSYQAIRAATRNPVKALRYE